MRCMAKNLQPVVDRISALPSLWCAETKQTQVKTTKTVQINTCCGPDSLAIITRMPIRERPSDANNRASPGRKRPTVEPHNGLESHRSQ